MTETQEHQALDIDFDSPVVCTDSPCASVGEAKKAIKVMRHEDCQTLQCAACYEMINLLMEDKACFWCTTCDDDCVLEEETWFITL